METEKYDKNSDPSLGYYPEPGWEWQKPEPKTYLVKHDLAQYARSWILNLIELIHWLPFIPAFLLAFYIFQHSGTLSAKLGTDIQVFLLMVSPLIQTFGGLMGIVMHEYEGWQVVCFQNPLAAEFNIKSFNNEWLREVAYKLLFLFQSAGLLTFSLGVFGINKLTLALAIFSGAIGFIGPQNPKVTFKFNDRPVFPLATSLMVVFTINATVNLAAYYYLFSAPLAAAELPKILSLLVPSILTLGGVIEGVVAESTFNQWWHFTAFLFINAAMFAELYFFGLLW